MKAFKYGSLPFDSLKIVYFKVFDKDMDGEVFTDATDEQILKLLAKKYHETIVITRIEDVEVLSVISRVPDKRILDISELKSGVSAEEREKRDAKVSEFKQKHNLL